MMSLPPILGRWHDGIAAELREVLGERELLLYGMMRYHLGWSGQPGGAENGGKLFRGSLCLAVCELLGGDHRACLPAAAGVELLHNFSLIHDDIEDGSSARRSRDTVWRVWGEAQAINAGDGMFALARLAVHRCRERGMPAESVLRMMQFMDEASLQLSEGQFRDIAFQEREAVTREEYFEMAMGKTGAVMGAAAALGALVAGVPPPAVTAFHEFGRYLGVAYQLRDDLLGIWGEATRMGKGVEEDLRSRKKSFPIVFALSQLEGPAAPLLRSLLAPAELSETDVREVVQLLEGSGAREATDEAARSLVQQALARLQPLGLPEAAPHELRAIADFVVERER